MKKIFITLSLFIVFLFSSLVAEAKQNYLHTITLENNNGSYNIILNSDSVSKVSKKIKSDNEIVLDIAGITPSETVNALYKGGASIDNLIVENSGFNKLKIYITAPNIASSSVIMQPQGGVSSIVDEGLPVDKIIWSVFVALILVFAISRSIKRTNEDDKILIKKDIKDREIALYRQYRKNLEEDMSINSKNAKMNAMLKKIDRKIDERLSMSIR